MVVADNACPLSTLHATEIWVGFVCHARGAHGLSLCSVQDSAWLVFFFLFFLVVVVVVSMLIALCSL